ncbi:hypothetical protein EBGED10_1530 [Bacillus sp. GeD10]|nr:hypothetical protein EBGED10_1530 [Bacillus sp. GeD10]
MLPSWDLSTRLLALYLENRSPNITEEINKILEILKNMNM